MARVYYGTPAFTTKIKIGVAWTLTCGLLAVGAGWAAPQASTKERPATAQPDGPKPKLSDSSPAEVLSKPRTDYYGDPLPPGALARLGSVQLRHAYATLAFSEDGNTLISAAPDGSIKFWEVGSGRQIRQLQLPLQSTWTDSVKLAPGGKLVAVSKRNEGVHLYETRTGQELRRLAPGSILDQLTFSPDGRFLAARGPQRGEWVWDVSTGQEYKAPKPGVVQGLVGKPAQKPTRYFFTIAFSPDSKFLATTEPGYWLRLWDLATCKELRHVRTQPQFAFLAISPNGQMLAAFDGQGTVELREAERLQKQADLKSNLSRTGAPCGPIFSPDSKLLAIAGSEIVIWDVAARKELHRWPIHGPHDLVFAPGGKYLACSAASRIHLWDLRTGQELYDRPGVDGRPSCVDVSQDGRLVACCQGAPFAYLWDTATGKPLHTFRHEESIDTCGFSPDGQWVITTGFRGGAVRIWDAASGKELQRLVVEDLNHALQKGISIPALHVSVDGKQMAAISRTLPDQCQMNLWDTVTGKLLMRRRFPPNQVPYFCCFTADGKGVPVNPHGNTKPVIGLIIADPLTGREIGKIPTSPETGPLRWPFAFSPDGKLAAVGIEDDRGGLLIAEVATGKHIMRINGLCNLVRFSPDGRVVLTADGNGIKLWELATRSSICCIPWRMPEGERHGLPISSLAFMPSGRALAMGTYDGTILIWDLSPKRWGPTAVPKNQPGKDSAALWDDLADPDAGKAYRVIDTLSAAPAQAIPLLAERLSQPLPQPDLTCVPQLIAELDHRSYAVREAAAKELARLGHLAEPEMRRALHGKPTAEMRVRLESLLSRLRGRPLPRETVRAIRAIQVLEWIGSEDARQILEKLLRVAQR